MTYAKKSPHGGGLSASSANHPKRTGDKKLPKHVGASKAPLPPQAAKNTGRAGRGTRA